MTAHDPWPLPISRVLLQIICLLATFFSPFIATNSIIMTLQILNDEIPAGKIVSIERETKSGPQLRLDNGHEVVFSNQVLLNRPNPIQLAVGDTVEKQHESCVYLINGKPISDFPWLLHTWLFPVELQIALGAYLIGSTLFIMIYGRSPLAGLAESSPDTKWPRWPKSRVGLLTSMLGIWVFLVTLWTALLGCMAGCLGGLGRAIRG
jgi:hypothetical protein